MTLRSIGINRKNILILFIITLIIIGGIFIFYPIKKIATQIIYPEPPVRIFDSSIINLQTPFSDNLTIKQPIFPENICNILDYGAIADGKTKNTQAFSKAIDDCYKKDGGIILVPNGTWLTGPIHLKSNLNLHLEDSAKIVFSTNYADYLPVVFSRFEGIEYYNYSPPIYANDAENIAITGNGTLDGQGSAWWKMLSPKTINKLYAMGEDDVPVSERVFGIEKDGLRPSFINFVNSRTILIDGVRILNGPMWTIHPIYSTDITIKNVRIKTAPGPSTDGIVLDSSEKALIKNCFLSTGDDAIVLKSGRDKDGQRIGKPTANIVISNNNIEEAHSALAIGSEMSGGINNIFFTDTNINRAQYAIRIKSQLGRGGIVENIWAQNTVARRIDIDAIDIKTSYGTPFRKNSSDEPIIQNIKIENVTVGRSKHAISIGGLVNTPVNNISLINLDIQSPRGILIKNSSDISFDHTNIVSGGTPLFDISESQNITISNASCASTTKTCLYLSGQSSENIKVSNTSFSPRPNRIRIEKNVKSDAIAVE